MMALDGLHFDEDEDFMGDVVFCGNCERRILDLGKAFGDAGNRVYCARECMWTAAFGGLKKEKKKKKRPSTGGGFGDGDGWGRNGASLVDGRGKGGPSLMDIAKLRAVEDSADDDENLNAMFVYHVLMAQSLTLFSNTI